MSINTNSTVSVSTVSTKSNNNKGVNEMTKSLINNYFGLTTMVVNKETYDSIEAQAKCCVYAAIKGSYCQV